MLILATSLDQTPLEKLDPAEAWKPAPDDRWNLRWAAHLYRRAGFGVPPRMLGDETPAWELLQAAVREGREGCLTKLLAGAQGQAEFRGLVDPRGRGLADSGGRVSSGDRQPLIRLQGWWLYRMLNSPHPLEERMTLFWHNHFATSVAKVGVLPLMYQQNVLLRQHALGKFQPLLAAVSRNPAMIVWLDSALNVKAHPNENYAREVMELFTLGIGNYTEKDIREAARSFTGWSRNGEEFAFLKELHDDGEKTVLGQRGTFGGDDIIRILLAQPAAARFIARKLYREFISDQTDPPEALLEPLAAQFRSSGYDVRAIVSTMLRSRLFFSAHAYRQKIKSPVDYVVGLTGRLDGPATQELAAAMDGLGQSLFEPPNVAGWKSGRTWLNSATLVARHNLAWRLLGGKDNQFAQQLNPAPLAKKYAKAGRAGEVDFLLDLFLEGDVGDEARSKLLAYAATPNKAAAAKEKSPDDDHLRQLAHTIALLPEYQLA